MIAWFFTFLASGICFGSLFSSWVQRKYLSDGEFAQYDAHWKQRDGHECDAKRHDKYSGGQRHDKYDAVFERIGMFLGSAIVRSNGCPCVRSDLALHEF